MNRYWEWRDFLPIQNPAFSFWLRGCEISRLIVKTLFCFLTFFRPPLQGGRYLQREKTFGNHSIGEGWVGNVLLFRLLSNFRGDSIESFKI